MYNNLFIVSVILVSSISPSFAQTPARSSESLLSIFGNVVDSQTNTALAFATIGIIGKSKGTIANSSGSFSLRLPLNFISDTLAVSMIGYKSEKIIIARSMPDLVIKMQPQPIVLNQVEVVERKISVEDIFKEIKARIKVNYPIDEYAMECFYREIKKENDTYSSLLEAALVLRDRGYNHPASSESGYIREVRGSNKFVNHFSDFWQENNLLRETLGLNAVRHPSSTPSVIGKDKYQISGISQLNGKEVYVLVSEFLDNDAWQRTLYVDVDTYAIYRSEETITNFKLSWKVGNNDSTWMRLPKGTSIFDFKSFNGKLYLNHIRHEVENEYFNPRTQKIFNRFTIINELQVNDIYEDGRTATVGLKRMENHALELQVTAYNKEFWESYNLVKQTPLEEKAMEDLMQKGALKDQFIESGKVQTKSNGKRKKQ